jgi:Metal-sensitive transcriptional repressor
LGLRRRTLRTINRPLMWSALAAGRERGECHLGGFGVSNQVLFVFVPDRVRVVDRGPCRLLGPRDRFNDSGVHPCGDREPGPIAAGRGDDVVSEVRAVGVHGDQPAHATRLGVVDVDVAALVGSGQERGVCGQGDQEPGTTAWNWRTCPNVNVRRNVPNLEGAGPGISRMVEDDKYCIDVLTQVSAGLGRCNVLGSGCSRAT